MKKKIRNLLAIVTLFAIVIGLLPVFTSAASDTADLGALMDSYSANGETFTLTANSRFFILCDEAPDGELLQTVQLAQSQFAADSCPTVARLPIVWSEEDWSKTGDIVIALDGSLDAEAYRLSVGSTAYVTAGSVKGLLYGLNMLHKHFRVGSNTLQGFTAADAPDTKQRAVSLDCGRKYYTKNWICNFIRQMSWMGYNTLELHFSDDSGFRMDFWDPYYYKEGYQPANDFSWICGSHYTSWTLDTYKNDPDKDKYLSTAEVMEILETAAEYHIEIIPAFDSPAHLDYLTWKYEQNYLSNTSYSFKSTKDDKTYEAADVEGCINYAEVTGYSKPQWPYYAAFDINSAQASAFIFELYIDIANFFKTYAGSNKMSIGADEVNLSYNPTWDFEDFVGYIDELNGMLNDMGYTMRMYNDFMGSISYGASDYKFDTNIEIMYWDSPHNPNGATANNHTEPVSYYVDKGMTLYNCIQTNTYYALRITGNNYTGSDARSISNRQWTFYHSDEDSIYDEWYPADISEHGDYSEDVADVPNANLGGAYFLIWCDYNCVSTEAEIWEGCYDKTGTGEFYSLLDRMWSNTIKMWNWDINDTVSYEEFAEVRDQLGDMPGLSSCSAEAVLPAPTAASHAYRADHSALTAALATKISGHLYSAESYATYEAAYTAATELNARYDATTAQMEAAIQALADAENALELRDLTLTIQQVATVGGQTYVLRTTDYGLTTGNTSFEVYLPPITGYTFEEVAGATFVPLAANDGSGYLKGNVNADTTITVKYQSTPETQRMLDLIAEAPAEQGFYSDESWNAYTAALNAAKNADPATQAEVDALVENIMTARSKLTAASETTKILALEPLTNAASYGKLVGLRVVTTPNVATLTVEGETLSLCSGVVQVLKDGSVVKVWIIGFPADEYGSFTYNVSAGSATATVKITVS